jgi:hypothetical protein
MITWPWKCVYSIPCNCGKVCIGQTGHSIATVVKVKFFRNTSRWWVTCHEKSRVFFGLSMMTGTKNACCIEHSLQSAHCTNWMFSWAKDQRSPLTHISTTPRSLSVLHPTWVKLVSVHPYVNVTAMLTLHVRAQLHISAAGLWMSMYCPTSVLLVSIWHVSVCPNM